MNNNKIVGKKEEKRDMIQDNNILNENISKQL